MFDPTVPTVFLHAHPDDETLATGGTLRWLADRNAPVTLITASRGERGDVVPGPLTALLGTPELAAERERELAAALAALGIRRHAFLGAPGARAAGLPPRRYLDSGMRWVTENVAGPSGDAGPDSLSLAPLDEVVADVLAALAATDARLVVSYDDDGGYGHPDHVRIAEAARLAAARAGLPYVAVLRPDEAASPGAETRDIRAELPAVRAALDAHRSQLSRDGDAVIHSGGQRQELATVEVYRRLA
jgi:N-acetyl-1-D-myo-inositol-2-amino-2-deoxy-alpha-D-glucopyranoside deacetylase